MTSMKKRIAATLTATILATELIVPAVAEAPAIRVSSYKGNTLKVGERSGLIIGPSDTDYAVTISAGESGAVTLTVGPATPDTPEAPADGNNVSLTDNLEIRQEMIRLINQTRKANGVSELPINEALMNSAQACSNRRYTWHHAPEESKAAADAGYPYGFGDNLTVFTGTADAAQHAVDNWINSPGHFETMIDPRCDCIGVGVTQYNGITYCYLFLGIPNSINFYA